ncbi:hypothetical protein GCK72_013800 [Caenorhabditis remanei]|uniref:Carboxylesterase type B domain-containing protein n=1 Tax=Caenorhabditis remanei TaxID=31234 RepID=A0A6A5GS31_CAERE|nr:hypothetical protein GCK72_013800 [Caenorhabditis remanei]KAF1757345.1 hypothetical protein GCK72_013800 [Caenorhabditis remanei]
MKKLLFILLNLLFVFECSIIKTSFGRIEGNEVGNFRSFKKIPFAKSPLGKLRFQKPETPDKWDDVLNAKEYGPACMSNSSSTTSPQKWVDEDCLHVNIFTSQKCLMSKNCPVVFYIHGGEMYYDSAVMFNDTILFDTFAKRDIVLVIPAFRLGIFSHFSVYDQSIAPNNLGMFDILHALEFTKSEIHNFGGDIKQTTVFGHSYGGHIVSMLQFSTKINMDLSLFQRAVSMSTAFYFNTLEAEIEKTNRFAEHSNCSVPSALAKKLSRNQQDTYIMECLQKIDGMELLRIQRSLEDAGFPLYDGLIVREPLIQEVPIAQLFDNPKNIPSLTGCTFAELDVYMAYHDVVGTLGFENYEECDEKFRTEKKDKDFELKNRADETMAILVQTKRRVGKLLDKNITTYLYEYSYPKHATHTDDLSYLMGVHLFEKDENEVKLAQFYQEIFTNFVKYGEPGEGFERTNAENSSYFNINWNETSGERPEMKNEYESEVTLDN